MTPEQVRHNGELITARGLEVGFTFNMDKRTHTYNTFDAHRLLHWAGLEGHQLALKHALLKAYFTDGENPSDHETLIRLCRESGRSQDRAPEFLGSDAVSAEVRARDTCYTTPGNDYVP